MIKARTGGMTAVAVLNFVFGGWAVLQGLSTTLVTHALISRSGEADPRSLLLILLALLRIGCGIVGIIAGIGILRILPWGRTMSLFYAWFYIAIGLIVSLMVLLQAGSNAAGTGPVMWSVLVALLDLIYPVTLIFLFRKPSWKQTFSMSSQAQPITGANPD